MGPNISPPPISRDDAITDRIHDNLTSVLIVVFLLFCGQLIYYAIYELTMNATFRTYIEKNCILQSCRLLPVYNNLDEFTVLHSSVTLLPNNNYLFKAIISNQSIFAQPYPNIALDLFTYENKHFTQLIVHPQNYLPKKMYLPSAMFGPNYDMEINFEIDKQEVEISDYTFSLTH